MRSRLIICMISLAIVISITLGAGATATKAQPTQGADWPMLDQNQQRTNYSPLENIIYEGNVTTLHSLWRQSINRGGYDRNPASNPVTYQGNVYVGGPSTTGTNF